MFDTAKRATRFLLPWLVGAFLLTLLVSPPASAHESSFRDVPESSYYHNALERLAAAQPPIISGFPDGTFRPDGTVTRAQFAKIIVQARALALVSPDQPSFSDVPREHWAYTFVETAKKTGILQGYSDGTFKPEAEVTRAEFSRGVVAANGWRDALPGIPSFTDVPTTHWAFADIERALAHRAIGGYPNGTFAPDSSITRSDAVTIIYRVLYPPVMPLIAIDPGHGGDDPGAIGNGLREKDVNLDVGLRVRALLLQSAYRIIMTRMTDVTVSLQTRCDIANGAKADIFVAIHHNSATSSAATGVEVYYYPGSVEGQKLAEKIQGELVRLLGLRDRGADSAEFYVLRHTVMPAVLTEAGFLSNPSDAAKLKTADFRKLEAQAIRNGIILYFASR